MASRKDPVARARGRKPAPVKKPFPYGFAAGCAALVLALGGILAYAVVNQGIADTSSLKYAEHKISGLTINHGLTRNHIDGKLINYPSQSNTPPDGGNHNPEWQSCQVYTDPIANEHAVHALEHGAVWITYQPSLPAAEVATLKKMVDGNPYRMLSPYPGLKSPISAQAWGEQMFASSASDSRIAEFAKLFTQGPQTQEPGASCVGTTDNKTTADAALTGGTSSSTGDPSGALPPGSSPVPVAPAAVPSAATTPKN